MTRVLSLLVLLGGATSSEVGNAAELGRVVAMTETPSSRLGGASLIAPGVPPMLMFRAFESSDRGLSGSLGLMIDDAGH